MTIANLNAWYRRLGYTAAFFLLLLSITGILLNHSAFLNLDSKTLPNWLSKAAYGYEPPTKAVAIAGLRIQQKQYQIAVNGTRVARCDSLFLNAIVLEELVAVICPREIVLLTLEGELIELASASTSFTQPIISFAAIAAEPMALLLGFSNHIEKLNINAMQRSLLSGEHAAGLSNLLQAKGLNIGQSVVASGDPTNNLHDLSWERFLLDLHSGRVFGLLVVLLMDVAALILIVLVFSGFWVWGKKQKLLKELEGN